jgi:exonuclease III
LVAGPFKFGFQSLYLGEPIVVKLTQIKRTKMRIVTWNCRMAFTKKREFLHNLRPDIAVVPECSRDAILACNDEGYSACWWGDNKNKGLGVLASKPWTLETGRRPTQKWIAPVQVNGPLSFLLLAVWAGPAGQRLAGPSPAGRSPVGRSKEKSYVGQIYEAVTRHSHWFAGNRPVVMCGDFNSNAIWDHSRKKRNHSAVVKLLHDRNLISSYHSFFSEEQGAETRPTYYFWHRKDRSFHIDYIFVPSHWSPRIKTVDVGTYETWRPTSDHVPIVVDIAEE